MTIRANITTTVRVENGTLLRVDTNLGGKPVSRPKDKTEHPQSHSTQVQKPRPAAHAAQVTPSTTNHQSVKNSAVPPEKVSRGKDSHKDSKNISRPGNQQITTPSYSVKRKGDSRTDSKVKDQPHDALERQYGPEDRNNSSEETIPPMPKIDVVKIQRPPGSQIPIVNDSESKPKDVSKFTTPQRDEYAKSPEVTYDNSVKTRVRNTVAGNSQKQHISEKAIAMADRSRRQRAELIERFESDSRTPREDATAAKSNPTADPKPTQPDQGSGLPEKGLLHSKPIPEKSDNSESAFASDLTILASSSPPRHINVIANVGQTQSNSPTDTGVTGPSQSVTVPAAGGLPSLSPTPPAAESGPSATGSPSGVLSADAFTSKLATALNTEETPNSVSPQSSQLGSTTIKNLQIEGVFGISTEGRNLGVVDFVKQKHFEYQLEQKSFSVDDFLKETEQSIYRTLSAGQSGTVAKSLIRAAESINAYRNQIVREDENVGSSVAAPPRIQNTS